MNGLTRPLIRPEQVSLGPRDSIKKALAVIDGSEARIALVVDDVGKLIGSVVDGDIRRGLLKGMTLESPVENIMAKDPYVRPMGTSRQKLLEAMRTLDIRQIPLVGEGGKLEGIVVYDMLGGFRQPTRTTPVVIMAGGKGKRLLPITTDMPKPLVPVGGRPMLEWILLRLTHYGLRNITLAVNYLGHMIEDYFGDGSEFDCHITYLREKEFLGTAGALSLLEKHPAEPMLVMNGDIISNVDFEAFIEHHVNTRAVATVCARAHRTEVPFGVIKHEGGWLTGMSEKPVYENLISTGIYMLSPEALSAIAKGKVTDMPTVLLDLASAKKPVGVFAMDDEWVDVGRHDDLERIKRIANQG